MSATKMSPFPILPATNAYLKNFLVELSYQIDGPFTGLVKKSDDMQPLHRTE